MQENESVRLLPDIGELLSDSGPFASLIKNFKSRSAQVDMAKLIETSLKEGKHLIVEAGTGVGKSLAYALPCALWPRNNQKSRIVIATYTKLLQEQLYKHVLPDIRSVLAKYGIDFNYSLLMGSENYLCLRRLGICLKRIKEGNLNASHKDILIKLRDWAVETKSGLRRDIPPEISGEISDSLWRKICRDPNSCTWKTCQDEYTCLYKIAYRKARNSNIVVTNQSYLLANVLLNPDNIPKYDAVIVDEAHNLEKVASDLLGFTITKNSIDNLLTDISDLAKCLSMHLKGKDRSRWIAGVDQRVKEAHTAAALFFDELNKKLQFGNHDPDKESNIKYAHVKLPNVVNNFMSIPFNSIDKYLQQAIQNCADPDEKSEFEGGVARCRELLSRITEFLECKSEHNIYWVESRQTGSESEVSISGSPVEVASYLDTKLFGRIRPVILTSATLTVNKSFDVTKSNLGFSYDNEKLLESTYNYKEQAAIYIAKKMPDPVYNYEAFKEGALDECKKIISNVPGGVFVLFTSWELLKHAKSILTKKALGKNVYVQGENGASNMQILQRFKRSGNGVLLGTDTFWQGIDVPGKELVCVIITRLPFNPHNTPLEQARKEFLESNEKSYFSDYSLPRAVIKFRQGFGRLIRNEKDYGVVCILDPRIKTKRYGNTFLNSIPKCADIENLSELKAFYNRRA
ncbi:MAG: ATP-dependent DNA helicase [Planctomycetes bacterium]|nr:ATP-dependent DNA helicase [Planctomycetota bacterium]